MLQGKVVEAMHRARQGTPHPGGTRGLRTMDTGLACSPPTVHSGPVNPQATCFLTPEDHPKGQVTMGT